jgi:hypothetical protein
VLILLHYRLPEPKVKEQRLKVPPKESRMSAMQWLVTQLAWEQRLGQLRTGEAHHEVPEDEAKRAA